MKTEWRAFKIAIVCMACIVGLASQASMALADTITVRFKPGAESARYNGSIQGYDDDTFVIDARRGQEMTREPADQQSTGLFQYSSAGV